MGGIVSLGLPNQDQEPDWVSQESLGHFSYCKMAQGRMEDRAAPGESIVCVRAHAFVCVCVGRNS